MPVYEEIETTYLTRIKNLNLSYESHANYRGDEIISPR
jgi:hypothetical protein